MLFAAVKAFPDLEFTCLVRNSDKGAEVASQYSKVRLVYGSLDDQHLLAQEAQKADIVLSKPQNNSDPPKAEFAHNARLCQL